MILGKDTFFEGEPIYAVFRVANQGSDTAWIGRFNLVELTLRIEVRTLDGRVAPQQGPIADYFPGPGWRGVPLAPGEAVYDFGVLQDRAGFYAEETRDLYAGHLPTGDYNLRARFDWRLDTRFPSVDSEALAFHVRPRTTEEQRVLTSVLELASMPWDPASRPRFRLALVEYAERRLAEDSLDPFLPVLIGRMVGTAWAVGYPPDSATLDRLNALRARTAVIRRHEPAGVLALAALYFDNPQLVRRLAPHLRGSLAGDIADALARRASTHSASWLWNRIEAQ